MPLCSWPGCSIPADYDRCDYHKEAAPPGCTFLALGLHGRSGTCCLPAGHSVDFPHVLAELRCKAALDGTRCYLQHGHYAAHRAATATWYSPLGGEAQRAICGSRWPWGSAAYCDAAYCDLQREHTGPHSGSPGAGMDRVCWGSDAHTGRDVCEHCGDEATSHVTEKGRTRHWCDAHRYLAGEDPLCRAPHPQDPGCDRPKGHEGDHQNATRPTPLVRMQVGNGWKAGDRVATKVYTEEQYATLERDAREYQRLYEEARKRVDALEHDLFVVARGVESKLRAELSTTERQAADLQEQLAVARARLLPDVPDYNGLTASKLAAAERALAAERSARQSADKQLAEFRKAVGEVADGLVLPALDWRERLVERSGWRFRLAACLSLVGAFCFGWGQAVEWDRYHKIPPPLPAVESVRSEACATSSSSPPSSSSQ